MQAIERLRRQLAEEQISHQEASAAFVTSAAARNALQQLLATCAARSPVLSKSETSGQSHPGHSPAGGRIPAWRQNLSRAATTGCGSAEHRRVHPGRCRGPLEARRPATAAAGGVARDTVTAPARTPMRHGFHELFQAAPRRTGNQQFRTASPSLPAGPGARSVTASCRSAVSAMRHKIHSGVELDRPNSDECAAATALLLSVDAVQWLLDHAFGPCSLADMRNLQGIVEQI